METIFKRYTVSLSAGFCITAVLVLVMHYAIHTDEPNIVENFLAPPMRWLPTIDEPDFTTRPKRKLKPEPPIKPPPMNKLVHLIDTGWGEGLSNEPPIVDPTLKVSGGVSEGDLLPIMVVAPEYPQRMLSRGVEGWVIVEFSVDKLGRVVDPKIIDAYPSSGFNQSALSAVLRYKYKPRVVNGSAVMVRGVQQRIVFNVSV